MMTRQKSQAQILDFISDRMKRSTDKVSSNHIDWNTQMISQQFSEKGQSLSKDHSAIKKLFSVNIYWLKNELISAKLCRIKMMHSF